MDSYSTLVWYLNYSKSTNAIRRTYSNVEDLRLAGFMKRSVPGSVPGDQTKVHSISEYKYSIADDKTNRTKRMNK